MISKESTGIEFTETMHGFLKTGAKASSIGEFERALQDGKNSNEPFRFLLTIKVNDIDKFIADPGLTAQAIGTVFGKSIGECQIHPSSFFNLFVDESTSENTVRKMFYILHFNDKTGNKLTFFGYKIVEKRNGFDVWKSTTTLYSQIFLGHISDFKGHSAIPISAGILRLTKGDFAKQLTTLKTTGPNIIDRTLAYAKFSEVFASNILETLGWDVLGANELKANKHPIPLLTLDGVRSCQKRTYRFSSGDHIGLSLERFTRNESRNVVLLLHGLSTSTDMFVMPEHRNLVSYLLDHQYQDVWSLDWRGSMRHNYNLIPNDYNLDDIALNDIPKAIDVIRENTSPDVGIHIICHCVGSITFMMSLYSGVCPQDNLASVVSNSVSLNPTVSPWSFFKISLAPTLLRFFTPYIYMDPNWAVRPNGLLKGKLFGKLIGLAHPECGIPACNMLSFMWGNGNPACYEHKNLHPITHARLGDLFGGVGVSYYRHIFKMLKAKSAVKYQDLPRYDTLPGNYYQHASKIRVPIFFFTGENNYIFGKSNIITYGHVKNLSPDCDSKLHVFPDYGHQDVFMGKNADKDIFPKLVEFMNQHRVQDVPIKKKSA